MSFDLGFFSYYKGVTAAKVREAYQDNAKAKDWPQSDSLESFTKELLEKYPDITEDNEDTSPWASSVDKGQGYFIVSLRPNENGEKAMNVIGGMLFMHDIIAYNPQTDEVTLEHEPID